MKYIWINSAKSIDDIYTDNYKILPREIDKGLNG